MIETQLVRKNDAMRRIALTVTTLLSFCTLWSQSYPAGYFRHPLNIPMQLVANFGEIRTNHWHMGLDIRTQQKENLPVYAAAAGYVARVVVEPGGFGQAIYINHPNGLTTLYAHLNAFFPALAQYVKDHQYAKQSWKVDLPIPAKLFPVEKGQYIAKSGNTGGSAGPHVHFEIRDTKTENVLNPILFKMPIADAVPPTLIRLAMYDRNRSTYEQAAQLMSIANTRNRTVKVGSDKISFAIGAVDRFSGTNNPNGIYSARIYLDDKPVSEFVLNDISYNDTRYINAQLDYPLAMKGIHVQHITPLPGENGVAYNTFGGDGIIRLKDEEPHSILIEVKDANGNISRLPFTVQYDPSLRLSPVNRAEERLLPNNVNVFERPAFELYTSESTIYDTVSISCSELAGTGGAVSSQFRFLDQYIPVHDNVTVRIKPDQAVGADERDRVVIKNNLGTKTFVQKGEYKNGWFSAKFRQFGSYQAFVDKEPPTINAVPTNLAVARRIVITPRDNFNSIKSFRAELDGEWLMFTNDKGKTWIYTFDEKFPRGQHELKVRVEDEAGNVTTKTFQVRR